ncbi:MAG: 50S ribosomal protein L9 [Syntrophorhabdaceae bacterium PtaU1.Bin034]|nr:MAG: 50S ribosomal protein L9 [Syntrophorhabdaceae bacterium PtaU1.Bin034]
MRVILLDNVEGVGKKGETHDVKDGFGRNFLVPRRLAMPATLGNIKKVQEQAKVIIQKREKDLKTASVVKERLEETPVTIKKKTGVDGKLFGSVTAKEIVDAIKKAMDLDVDRRTVRIDEPIKMTGVHTVEVHLEKGIIAQLRLEVEEE